MFRIYGDGVFLETTKDNSPATLAEFKALGYDNVTARPVEDLFDGTEEGAEKAAEKWSPPAPAAPIEWPKGFDNAEEWENRVMREAEERDALAASFQDETETESEGKAE